MSRFSLAVGLVVALFSTPSFAQPKTKEIKLTVSAVGVSVPLLEHRLLPGRLDRTDGNAAPIYYRCALMAENASASGSEESVWSQITTWLDTPVNQLPQDKVRQVLKRFGPTLSEVEIAARRSECRWEMPVREQGDNLYGILLPELHGLRNVGRLLALRARLEIAENKYEDAIQTLQTGFAMARHLAEQPFLVCDLVGMAVASMMGEQILAFSEAPAAPNLYWAISSLPRPFISMHESYELEGAAVHLMFPQLRNTKSDSLTESEWEAELERLRKLVEQPAAEEVDKEGKKQPLTLKGILAKASKARAGLVERGYTKEQVADMPAAHAILVYSGLVYDELRDDLFRWLYVPYPVADAELANAEGRFEAMSRELEIIPLARLTVPSVGSARRAATRAQRQRILLRTVEAIRHHTGEHAGQLPKTLAEVSLPLSDDPVTGKPFEYHVTDGTATLEAPAIGKTTGVRFLIDVAK